jgi:hypothetical protein
MLSDRAKEALRAEANITDPCECKVTRTSKWGVQVDFARGLCLLARFKFNCRTRTKERVI